jgi:hypothetical protein
LSSIVTNTLTDVVTTSTAVSKFEASNTRRRKPRHQHPVDVMPKIVIPRLQASAAKAGTGGDRR